MQKIKTVCVIGSGVMGSGIAAQVANSKTNVILLDIVDKNSSDRNKIVKDAYDKLFTQKPPPLSHPDYAKYIKLGNLEDDIALIKEADLIIEVIVEKLEIKHQLYESISKYLKPTAILASNTSTLPLSALKENLPQSIKERFVITHFFNPPRYMELLELVSDSQTDQAIIPKISDFLVRFLGKTIVNCNDTPGFIANRVGCFLLELVVRRAINEKLRPEQIDYIFTTELGFPSTGIFGLYDLIGHDVMDLISKSLLKSLPKGDKYHEIYTSSVVLDEMRTRGLIGRKAGAGFYKMVKDETGRSVKQVIDWVGKSYGLVPEGHPEGAVGFNDAHSFINKTLQEFFSYVNSLVPEVTSLKENIDKAMKLGYSLKYGPFELMERLGANRVEALTINPELSTRHPEALAEGSQEALLSNETIILSNDSAHLKIENDRYIFVIKSKMNALDKNVFNLMIQAKDYCEQAKKTMYIFPQGNNFSAGANLRYFKENIEQKNFKAIDEFLALGQRAMLGLKYAKIPVVSCARGVALGGGAEILLHSSQLVAHQNLSAGLVELGVGLIPAFGGTKEMFMRAGGDKVRLLRNLGNILRQNKSSSADYFADDYGVSCSVSMHKDLLLETVFDSLYRSGSDTEEITLPDVNLMNEFDTSTFDALQIDVLKFFQKIVDKKTLSENQLLDLEREKFLELASKPLALEKISKFVF